MREYVEDKLFLSFLVFVGVFTYFIGMTNNRQMKEGNNNNNIVYVEK